MADRTVVERMRRQRELRTAEGWQEIKVWVPTEADAEDVRKLAEERRAKAEALTGLIEEISKVNTDLAARVSEALATHGSTAYITPSGAVLDLLTQLAEEEDLNCFSRVFVILTRAKPANAAFVAAAVPAKVSNFLIRHRGVDTGCLLKWTEANPGWADELKAAVRDPARFVRTVEAMAERMKRSGEAN